MADFSGKSSWKAVSYIIMSEACERFCYYGIRTTLALYLITSLEYSEFDAIVIFHTFVCLAYLFPIVGATISDSYLGKYKTIMWLFFIYIAGCLFLVLGSCNTSLVSSRPGASFIGLALIALASGGIKPCISAFGGDQFVMPAQVMELIHFFSKFYFAIGVGSVSSTAVMPILAQRVECFGERTCYLLAFGIGGLLMLVSFLIFILGTAHYKIIEPEKNILVEVSGCIGHAIKMKMLNLSVVKAHWLDHAADKYDQSLIEEIKMVLRVLVVFIPVPIFWSLYEQQGSGWTFQARRMRGEVGRYTILPDQMQIINPLMVMVLIVVFQYTVYPCMQRLHCDSPLQKMVIGGFLISLAFFVAGAVSKQIEFGQADTPIPGYGQVRIYNTVNCDVKITSQNLNEGVPFEITRLHVWAVTNISICGLNVTKYKVEGDCFKFDGDMRVRENEATGYYFYGTMKSEEKGHIIITDDLDPQRMGWPKVRFLINYGTSSWKTHVLNFTGEYHGDRVVCRVDDTRIFVVKPDIYVLRLGKNVLKDLHLHSGGIYVVMAAIDSSNSWVPRIRSISLESSVHMLWQLPQYILLSSGEVMFAVSGLEFAYSQAPLSMKSVLQACYLVTYAIGNIIVIVISRMELYKKQSSYFFFYSSIMAIDTVILACLAMDYTYAPT